MPARVLIVILAFLFAGDDGADEGRRGNSLYADGTYGEAASAYRSGLSRIDDEAGSLATGLWNNLGAALHQLEQYEDAASAFQQAIDAAATPAHRARALYNAGNNAAAQKNLEAALDFYRKALLANPGYEDARFNYEYVKREMAKRQQSPSRSIEPSDYARKLKRRAEALAQNRRYEAAYRLMQQGLQRDSTVAAFQSFITRLSDVTQIDTTYR